MASGSTLSSLRSSDDYAELHNEGLSFGSRLVKGMWIVDEFNANAGEEPPEPDEGDEPAEGDAAYDDEEDEEAEV